jgi:hypothetical protein
MNGIYETRFKSDVWRVEPITFNNHRRVSIWPFYTSQDGSLKPGRGGLQIPLDEVEAFVEAIIAAAKRLK